MEVFGMICTVLGVGTLSAWIMKLIVRLDGGKKNAAT